ncbi:MAG: hypothetical protein HOJ79_11995 [Nitrospina sp.]|jgi:hypothetical protein|nr:hypothetical protein [Nitrospina sp.]
MKFKSFFIVLGIVVVLFLLNTGVNLFVLSTQANHKINEQSLSYLRWYRVFLKDLMVQVATPITASREAGLPKVRLYIPQKIQNALMSDPPSSTKKWHKSSMIYPDGKMRSVKVRNRGDNPLNWVFDKKAWRVKLKKKNLINNIRIFDYVLPSELFFVGNHITNSLARRTGLLAPRSRMIEMFINEKSSGIYLEVERLNESFLRSNGVMPVNLYKGEQIHGEQLFLTDNALLGNPGLWKKISAFNQVPEEDFSDLAYFLDLIRRAINSEEDFNRLKKVARFSDWARFAAFQTLVQSWSNERLHNLRLIYDPWRGSVIPIAHDTQGFRVEDSVKEPRLIFESHALLTLYNTSSEFLLEKYRFLYEYLSTGLIPQIINEMDSLYPLLKRSFSRDPFRYQVAYANNMADQTPLSLKDLDVLWNSLITFMRESQSKILSQVSGKPSIQWVDKDGRLGLVLDGPIPVNQISINIPDESSAPEMIKWDADGDGENSDADISIPFHREDNQIILEATWIANQVTFSSAAGPYTYDFTENHFEIVPTQFWLVMDKEIAPDSVFAANALTGKVFEVEKGSRLGNTPSRWNKPIFQEKSMRPEIWTGELVVDGVRIVEQPVRILAGTTIKMGSGASLIFRNKLQVEGTKNAPVKVTPATPGIAWGTIALHGHKTENSVLSHLVMEGGSGKIIENIRYIAMLSVHEADDVKFQNLTLRNNSVFDDMMHVVYSNNVRIKDCVFENAFSDGLDVDISEVSIDGCNINNSGNDAIDLMSSKVLVQGATLLNSGDKGISVGEGSEVLIFNSHIKNNSVGVESKEASSSYIVNSDFVNNKKQISAYKKNWRYQQGGSVFVDKAVFHSSDNQIEADKNSEIKIFDSAFSPEFPQEDRRIVRDKLSEKSDKRKSASSRVNSAIAGKFKNRGLQVRADIRGAIR